MRVVHFSTSDRSGGAAIAAYRLHRGLREAGVDSFMIAASKITTDWSVLGPNTPYETILSRLLPYLDKSILSVRRRKPTYPFSPSIVSYPFTRKLKALKPDVIHIHWVQQGFLRPENLSRIKAPVVWTLHDMWPFTGGCHYTGDCLKYRSHCGCCPILQSHIKHDLSFKLWRRKQKSWSNVQLNIIALSKWMIKNVRNSSLLGKYDSFLIPNGLDLDVFRPIDKIAARNILGLNSGKTYILFGALSPTTNPYKGYDLLHSALKVLSGDLVQDVELLVFGSLEPRNVPDFGLPVRYLGNFHDDVSLALVYSAADVFVTPSKQDNLPNTVIEAMAFGTPVAAFSVGGMPDLIDHKRNGYLASPQDYEDLAMGIYWILSDTQRHKSLCESARVKVENYFSATDQVERIIRLYENVLEENH